MTETRVYMMPEEPPLGSTLKDSKGREWVRTGKHAAWGNWESDGVSPYPLSWLKLLTTHGPLYEEGAEDLDTVIRGHKLVDALQDLIIMGHVNVESVTKAIDRIWSS